MRFIARWAFFATLLSWLGVAVLLWPVVFGNLRDAPEGTSTLFGFSLLALAVAIGFRWEAFRHADPEAARVVGKVVWYGVPIAWALGKVLDRD